MASLIPQGGHNQQQTNSCKHCTHIPLVSCVITVALFGVLVFRVVGVTASLGTDLASELVADNCFMDGDGRDDTFGTVQDAGRGGGGGGPELIPAVA